MSKTSHAKIFDVRGNQVLAFLDHDEERDNLLVLRFRLWSDAAEGPLSMAATIDSDKALTDEIVSLWEANTRKAFDELTAERVETVLEKMDVFSLLEMLEAKNPY